MNQHLRAIDGHVNGEDEEAQANQPEGNRLAIFAASIMYLIATTELHQRDFR
jgi:hypothetical protein